MTSPNNQYYCVYFGARAQTTKKPIQRVDRDASKGEGHFRENYFSDASLRRHSSPRELH
jgi:hypothetical protein